MARKIQGTVVLEVVILKTGQVGPVRNPPQPGSRSRPQGHRGRPAVAVQAWNVQEPSGGRDRRDHGGLHSPVAALWRPRRRQSRPQRARPDALSDPVSGTLAGTRAGVLATFIEISTSPSLARGYRYPRLTRNPLTREVLMPSFLARRLRIKQRPCRYPNRLTNAPILDYNAPE